MGYSTGLHIIIGYPCSLMKRIKPALVLKPHIYKCLAIPREKNAFHTTLGFDSFGESNT